MVLNVSFLYRNVWASLTVNSGSVPTLSRCSASVIQGIQLEVRLVKYHRNQLHHRNQSNQSREHPVSPPDSNRCRLHSTFSPVVFSDRPFHLGFFSSSFDETLDFGWICPWGCRGHFREPCWGVLARLTGERRGSSSCSFLLPADGSVSSNTGLSSLYCKSCKAGRC